MIDSRPVITDYAKALADPAVDAVMIATRAYACPPEDALHGVVILEAIVASARSGRPENVE
jgi:hypothetical protein